MFNCVIPLSRNESGQVVHTHPVQNSTSDRVVVPGNEKATVDLVLHWFVAMPQSLSDVAISELSDLREAHLHFFLRSMHRTVMSC